MYYKTPPMKRTDRKGLVDVLLKRLNKTSKVKVAISN